MTLKDPVVLKRVERILPKVVFRFFVDNESNRLLVSR